MPGVIGAIGGTHSKIIALSIDEDAFINRKKVQSINTQVVFDTHFNILDVVAKRLGSSHDSRILMESSLRQLFERHHVPVGCHVRKTSTNTHTEFTSVQDQDFPRRSRESLLSNSSGDISCSCGLSHWENKPLTLSFCLQCEWYNPHSFPGQLTLQLSQVFFNSSANQR